MGVKDCCQGCFDGCMGCLSRVPFATLVATILSLCGVGVFCGCMYKATEYTLRILLEILRVDVPHSDIMRNVFISIGVIMFVIIIFMLIVGFASTGSTREMVYSGPKGQCGGRCALGFFIGLSYFLNIVWMVLTCVIVAMLFIFGVLYGFCLDGVPPGASLDLRPWGFLFGNDTRFNNDEKHHLNLQQNALTQLCDQANDAFPWYIASYCASFVIVLGLVHFLICLSSNFAHVSNGQKMQEYDDARYLEEQELGNMAKS